MKAQKHYTKEELQKIQDEMPEYLRGAVVSSGESKEGPKEAFKLNKLIPESLRKKVTESENYKEYLNFKENLK